MSPHSCKDTSEYSIQNEMFGLHISFNDLRTMPHRNRPESSQDIR